ncbi:hypothetical protein CCR75_007772 [Bremia lactucae]|uniref:Acyltransferase 3 domain-containing protein n=1 Tax=Bremia lactucae TaxID=4779 RepID=A0A976IJ60_BRELC|nr:hypothetical protein CCR75_007772 [Bremia lactucae]
MQHNVEDETNNADELQPPPEDHPLLVQEEGKSSSHHIHVKATKALVASKILFLDGVRGLAALLVFAQHVPEYLKNINVGAVAVDSFFVLSSFLLTWLFMKKSLRLVHERAGLRKWLYVLADYFCKRFFRVYPLFAITCVVLWFMDVDSRRHYYLGDNPTAFDLFKTLTFEFHSRYFVFWTLPLEISYYFCIPVFVYGTIVLRRLWWIAYLPAYYWVISQGWTEYRTSHTGLLPHIPTFLAGSMAAVIFVKLDTWIKARKFQFQWFHTLVLRAIELTALGLFLSVVFRGLFFVWIHENVAPKSPGFPFTSVLLTILLVCELLLPSPLSRMMEWNFLRFWGKVSFSVYLLHGFVIYNERLNFQTDYYCRLFSRLGMLALLTTASYQLVEYPSQLLARRISKTLDEQEAKASMTMPVLCTFASSEGSKGLGAGVIK